MLKPQIVLPELKRGDFSTCITIAAGKAVFQFLEVCHISLIALHDGIIALGVLLTDTAHTVIPVNYNQVLLAADDARRIRPADGGDDGIALAGVGEQPLAVVGREVAQALSDRARLVPVDELAGELVDVEALEPERIGLLLDLVEGDELLLVAVGGHEGLLGDAFLGDELRTLHEVLEGIEDELSVGVAELFELEAHVVVHFLNKLGGASKTRGEMCDKTIACGLIALHCSVVTDVE